MQRSEVGRRKEAEMPTKKKAAKPAIRMTWKNPPPAQRGRGATKLRVFVAALKERPNEWALYRTDAPNAATVSANTSRYAGTEWTSRKQPNGKFHIYGRYIGK